MTTIPLDVNPESNDQMSATTVPGLVKINPEMVALARLASGMTQQECADAMGISQARLSKLEDSLVLTIEAEPLNALSKASGYPIEFFSQTGERHSLGEGFFRKRTTVPAKIFKRIEALINVKRIELSKLVSKVELDHKERPAWDVDSFKGGAQEIARHLRHFWSIPNGPIKNLVEIVEDAGCVVVMFDFETPKIDGLTIYCGGTPIILLNPNVSYVRQRSTLSHELGHVIMHKMPTGTMEEEAFAFASEFMMPEHEVRPGFFPLNVEKLIRLKAKWKVSMQWLLRWANTMGAVSAAYYRVLMMKISQSGWRKVEPYDAEWELERPSLLSEIMTYVTSELRYSIEDLKRLLNPNSRTFQREYFKTPILSVV